ncbi:hypothetical protein [Massilia sp. YIM B02443]|uniref:hypothetical protein n=1 Tax=Massilia sp. YIM B02443 TaxID=3050127 RepID=UPI0025B72157|nr:hypothetical protein [Massilia sp. YIM B02443]MDN4039656.1 hypothetical protein [Massilia sp. YIM B02443]
MLLFSRLFAPRRRKNQEEVAGRAAEVIAQVLFDVGIDRFLNGSMLLDRQFRLRFFAVPPGTRNDVVATIAVRDLAEAQLLRACVRGAALDAAAAARHARSLSDALMREMLACSPELRALPARRVEQAQPA